MFAVDKSKVTLPPVPKSLKVSLNVVADINVLAAIDVVAVIFPVKASVLPSNVILFSTLTFGDEPSNVKTPLSNVPLKVANPEVPDVLIDAVPEVPDVNPAGDVPDVPEVTP